MYSPSHPGRVLKDALEAVSVTVTEFAAHTGVSRVTLSRILNEKAGISAEMSIKLTEAFG